MTKHVKKYDFLSKYYLFPIQSSLNPFGLLKNFRITKTFSTILPFTYFSLRIPEIPDWRKPGVEFGWVRFTSSSRFLPAFIYPKEKNQKRIAQQILSIGANCQNPIDLLAATKNEVDAIATATQAEKAKKSKKSKPYLAAIKQFNLLNNTTFE